MDMEEIRYLLGSTIFARAKAYLDRVEDLDCETSENGVRHLTADVRGGGRNRYHTQAWLRENGSFVSASCTCPYNENGEGPCCKHIGALLMLDEEGKTQPAAVEPAQKTQLNNIPGVVRGTEFAQESAARKDSYASSLEMLFGKKWRGDEPESDPEARALLRQLLGRTGEHFTIKSTFWCDYGRHITIGENFFCNYNCVMLDCAPITFGDNVMVAPNCGFYTAAHPLDHTLRDEELEYAKPITVGDSVWIGGGVTVLPGVTIGSRAVIGGGSVVVHDIPEGVVAVGNPCRPIRTL